MRKNGVMKYKWHISLVTLVLFCLSLVPIPNSVVKAATEKTQKVKVRFDKGKSELNYAEWDIWTWVKDTTEGTAVSFTHEDEEGVYALLDVPETGELGLIVRKKDWSDKAYGEDYFYDLSKGGAEIVFKKGEEPQVTDLYKAFEKLTVNINYNRLEGDYSDWNIWNWLPDKTEGKPETVVQFTEDNDFGKVGIINFGAVDNSTTKAAFIVRTNEWDKDGKDDRIVDLAYADCNGTLNVYVKQGVDKTFYTQKDADDYKEDTNPGEPGIPSDRKPVLVGSIQKPISGEDWNPASTETVFKHMGDSFYTLTAEIPAGEYEYKVAFGSWDENYGIDGKQGGDNIKLSLVEDTEVTFYYSDKTHLITDSTSYAAAYGEDKRPRLAGTIQSAMGEEADWNPSASTLKLYDHNFNGMYSIDLANVPKGSYEFKVAIGGSWDEAYGDNSENYKLVVPDTADVNITFNSESKEITTKVYATVEGEFDGVVNGKKLYHNTWDSVYKYPFGAIEEKTPITLRLHAQKGDLQYARILVRNNNTNKSELYNMDKVSNITLEDGSEVEIWEATFTPEDYGVYGYKFIAGDGDSTVYYGEDGKEGEAGQSGDKNTPFFQLTVYDDNYSTPDWMKEAVVYQILTDRFNNGDKSNDTAKENARGNEPIERPVSWDALPDNPRLAERGLDDVNGAYSGDEIWSNDFFGGDIKGIQDKLDYLQSLGVNTLYLNPISMAASNHKYDATDYKALDSMFGTEEEFKKFTAELNKRGMHLIVDGVFNHVGDDSIYFDRYGKYEWVGAYEYWSYVYDAMNANSNLSQEDAMKKADKYFVDNGQKFSDEKWHLWFNIKNEKVDVGTTNERYDYQAWWGYDSLPEFKSMTKDEAISLGLASSNDEFVNKESEWNNKSLVDYIYKSEDSVAKQWIDWGASGWRLDVANEVETTFWNDFREEMKAHNSDTLILGEIWDDASQYFVGDQYDSVMNYRIRGALMDYLKTGNATRLNDTLMAVYEDYPQEAFYALMNLMGSHDVARAKYILGGGSDTEQRAEFGNYDEKLGEQRLMLAALFEFGYPGAPTIYYGDEAGVTGSSDPDCRRTYPWGEENTDLISYYSLLGKTREANKDLFSHGDLVTLYSSDNVYAYGRSYNGETAIVITNPTTENKTISIDLTKFTGNGTEYIDQLAKSYKVAVKDGKVEITVPAMTGRILVNSNKVTLPNAVSTVTGTEGNSEVTLTWNAVDGADTYKVYASSFKGSLHEEVATVKDTTATISNLVNGDKKYFAISAVDKAGNESPLTWSEGLVPHAKIAWAGNVSEITVSQVDISSPINVTAEAFIEGVTEKEGVAPGLYGRLLVKYPGDSEFTAFNAKYIGEAGKNDEFITSFIANKPGEYEYKFEFTTRGINGFNDAKDDIYALDSKMVTLDKGDDVAVAKSITLETPEQQSGEVNLKWSVEEANNIALYEVVRDGIVVARIKDGAATSYRDIDVRNKVGYTYEVIAYSNGGNAVKSNEVTVTPDLVMVEVTFKLKAPSYTPLDTKVTIPGQMNGWNVDAWEMSRNGAVTTDWTYTTYVLEGETIEYKYVKGGNWDQEALMNYTNPKAANQSKYGCTTGEGGNEKVVVENQGDGKMVIENEVIRWKDMPFVILDPSNGSFTKNETITIKGNTMLDPYFTINGNKVDVDENGDFTYDVPLAIGKNEIAIHIEPTEENKNNPDIFNQNEEAIGFATKDAVLEITRLGEGEELPAPTINAKDRVVKLGSEFNPLEGVTAIDYSGKDLTANIVVKENTVDTKKAGEYKVVYEVVDSDGRVASKEIKVTVNKEGVIVTPDNGSNNNGSSTEKPGNNGNGSTIPNTGGTNSFVVVIIALVFVGSGVMLFFRKRNNLNKK